MAQKQKTTNITTAIPIFYLNGIQKLIDLGLYESRSQIIRKAVERALFREEKVMPYFDFETIKEKGDV